MGLSYRGIIAEVGFTPEAAVFYAQACIGNDLISIAALDLTALNLLFKEAVEDYLSQLELT